MGGGGVNTAPARVTVARNIRRLRQAAGWTQDEACERLAKHGHTWTRKAWSLAERSADDAHRARAFTADEVAALAAVFEVSPGDLFDAPVTFAPAANRRGDELWLTAGGTVECVGADDAPGGDWVRLYRPARQNGPSS